MAGVRDVSVAVAPERASVGRPVPDISVMYAGARLSLAGDLKIADRRGRWLFLVLLPPDNHPGCAGEIAALEAHANVLRGRGCEVIAVASSPSSEPDPRPLSPWRGAAGTVGALRRAVDPDGEVARVFGVEGPVRASGCRAVFLIDPAGVLRMSQTADCCLGQGSLDPGRILAAFQGADDCPRKGSSALDLPAAPPPVLGGRFGPFVIEERIGEGAFSTVYRARDTRLDRVVALKLLQPGQHVDLAVVLHEAKVGATLSHGHVCTIYDVLESTGTPMIVMELLTGGTLIDRMVGGPLGTRRARSVVRGMALALQALHGAGVVHGDLKPGNVMFTADGVVKLVDFGVALLEGHRVVPTDPGSFSGSRSGATVGEVRSSADADTVSARGQFEDLAEGTLPVVCGTPSYMAPELLEGQVPTPESDLWAMGVLVVELTTGLKPFRGESFVDLLFDQLRSDPRRLAREVPSRWREVVRNTLSVDPRRRMSASELVRMLGAG